MDRYQIPNAEGNKTAVKTSSSTRLACMQSVSIATLQLQSSDVVTE